MYPLIRGLDQVFVSKHMVKPFKHSAELFKQSTELLNPQRKIESLAESLKNSAECLKRLDTCLCYSTAYAVESTMIVFPIYPEAYCQ